MEKYSMIRLVLSFLLVIVLLGMTMSCERYIDSRDPVRSLPEDGPIPTNLTVEINNQSVVLSWDIANPDIVSKYRVYVAKEEDSIFVLHDSTTTTSIEMSDLHVNQRYLLRVTAVTSENLEWEPSEIVNAIITYLSIELANGDEYTSSRDITVRINAPSLFSHVMISEDSTFADAQFVPATGQSASFELSEGDGVKYVFVKLQLNDGSVTGEPLRDSIILDTQAAIDSVFFLPPANGQYFGAGDTITFGLSTGETGGRRAVAIITGAAVPLYDDGTNADPDSGDGIYYGTWVVPVQFVLNAGEVTGEFTDIAGNTASPRKADILLNVFTAPLPVTLSATTLSTFEITLNWTRSTSNNFASYRLYRSTSSNVTENSTLLDVFPSATATSYTDTTLTYNQTYYYRLYTYDKVGQSVGSDIASAHTLNNLPPETVELTIVPGASTVDLYWTASDERDFESYRIYRGDASVDDNSSIVLIERNQNVTSAMGVDLQGSPYVRIYVFDRHGFKAAGPAVQVP